MDYPKRLQGRSLPRLRIINQQTENLMQVFVVRTQYILKSEQKNTACNEIDCFVSFSKAAEYVKSLTSISNIEVTKIGIVKKEVK